MKTIRTNTFETNSSSSHSFTIENKETPKPKELPPIFKDGILYPSNIEHYTTSDFYGNTSSYTLIADDVHLKLGLVIQMVTSFLADAFFFGYFEFLNIIEKRYNLKIDRIDLPSEDFYKERGEYFYSNSDISSEIRDLKKFGIEDVGDWNLTLNKESFEVFLKDSIDNEKVVMKYVKEIY